MQQEKPPTPKKFLTNQGENTLSKRLEKILPLNQDFDCLVGYFFISGFFRLYPAPESVKKVRIIIGLKNEQVVHGLIQIAQDRTNESIPSTAEAEDTFGGMLKKELVQAADSLAIETGIRKFIEWIRSGKLEVKLYRDQNIHAKVAASDVYFIKKKRGSEFDLKYLLGILNSKLCYFWLYHKGQRKGDLLQLFKGPLSEIPIYKPGNQAGEVVTLVDRILTAKLRGAGADTSELEQLIDTKVFDLYGLSEAERALVMAPAS